MEQTAIIDKMTVNAMESPLGIDDKNPVFAWRLRADRRGARQTNYQILVKKRDDGAVVWDSGKISSGIAVGIVYGGTALEACTQYSWQVSVCDEKGDTHTNESWFETGLMGTDASVWSGAEWIGAPGNTVNTAALDTYRVSFAFHVEKGNKAGFVTGARNKDNYILVEIDMERRAVILYEYCDNAWAGSRQDGHRPSICVLGSQTGYPIPEQAVPCGEEWEEQQFSFMVNKRAVTVEVNGIEIIKGEKLIPETPVHQPRKGYLMSIGFKQENSRAAYRNLIIQNTQTGDIYQNEKFANAYGPMSVLGTVQDGRLIVENQFELMCPVPSVQLRETFCIAKPVKTARLYAAARGFYTGYINGEKVYDSYFNPGFTDYRLRIQYQTFDVTDMLHEGENMIGAVIGKGYYSGYCGYSGAMIYGQQNSFIGKLMVIYEDGTHDTIVTDSGWRYTDRGPVTDSDYLDGENYDARLELDGWGDAAYDDAAWKDCGIKAWPSEPKPTNGVLEKKADFQLSAQEGPMAEVVCVLPAIKTEEIPKGHYVYDFGQNMVGTIKLKVKGERGTSLKIRYGEMCYKNGEIYIQNLRTAANTDTYTLKGDPDGEVFIPSFTAHGFRYVEITGNGFVMEDNRLIVSIEGLALSNVHKVTGSFVCSNPMINQLQSNIQWGQRGNSLLVLTDCPQRNERMGWTGDAQVFAATSAYNMDVAAFTKKWMQDVIDGQLMYNVDGAVPDTAPLGGDNRSTGGCAGWGDAAVIVPWKMYQAYGDSRILEQCYEMMAKWIAYQDSDKRQNHGVRTVQGREMPEQSDLASIPYIQVQQSRGDHLTFDESTPFILSATAYAAHVAELMAETARLLGKDADAEKYRKRYELVKQAFQEAWVQEDGTLAYWGEMSKSNQDINGNVINQTYYSNKDGCLNHPSQTAYALAIDFGLIPGEKLQGAVKGFKQAIHDRDGKLSVGFLGISHLAPALTKVGMNDQAFALLEQTENPSWLYSVKNGATTIWERWNSYIAETGQFGDVSMNSFNHYAYGAIGEWMYQTILGIQSSVEKGEAGYKKIILKPTIGGNLSYARGKYESVYGQISSEWILDGNVCTYKCTVPANTAAELYLDAKPEKVLENGIAADKSDGVVYIGEKEGRTAYLLESGSYCFTMRI